jgi:hypothetical protein
MLDRTLFPGVGWLIRKGSGTALPISLWFHFLLREILRREQKNFPLFYDLGLRRSRFLMSLTVRGAL